MTKIALKIHDCRFDHNLSKSELGHPWGPVCQRSKVIDISSEEDCLTKNILKNTNLQISPKIEQI